MTTHDEDIESVAARVQNLRADLEWGCELRERAADLIRRLRDERDEARKEALDEAAHVIQNMLSAKYEPTALGSLFYPETKAILDLKSQEPSP